MPAAPQPIIEVQHLSKRYRLGAIGATSLRESFAHWLERRRGRIATVDQRDFWALRDVSFTVRAGEVVGVIGRNGAGKSTLLKLLSRITEPTSGRAILRGRVASLLEVGTGFHPDLTGRENIFLNGAILGMTRAEIRSKFDEIVAFAEVAQFIDTPVKRYSSGMYVRLAFAVAAHLEPEILIIDEVLAVGDAAFQNKCLGKLRGFADNGRTVLFVSHHMSTVAKLCSRALLIHDGRISFEGTATAAVQAYFAAGERATAKVYGTNGSPLKPAAVIDAWMERHKEATRHFLFGDREARVVLILEITSPVTLGIELVLLDGQKHTISFGASGLLCDQNFAMEPGRYLVTCDLPPLELAKGNYSIDLLLAISGEKLLDHVESGLTFSIDSTSIGSRNWNFSQDLGRGCQLWHVRFSEPRVWDGVSHRLPE